MSSSKSLRLAEAVNNSTRYLPTQAPKHKLAAPVGTQSGSLGQAMDIKDTAKLLWCSTWTVRRRLIPRGLPHFRVSSVGKTLFYRDQVVRWVEAQQNEDTVLPGVKWRSLVQSRFYLPRPEQKRAPTVPL